MVSERTDITVMLVDDTRAARIGFMMMLQGDVSIRVVSQASNGAEAIDYLHGSERELPDVMLMDVRMPVMDGIEATGLIKEEYPSIKILILTTYDQDDYAFDGLARGSSGFLLKDVTARDLYVAIHAVYHGDAVLTPRITGEFLKRDVRRIADARNINDIRRRFSALSSREYEVASLVAQGLQNHEIAQTMVIEDASVRRMVSRILPKMGFHDRVQIAIAWYQAGLDQLEH